MIPLVIFFLLVLFIKIRIYCILFEAWGQDKLSVDSMLIIRLICHHFHHLDKSVIRKTGTLMKVARILSELIAFIQLSFNIG